MERSLGGQVKQVHSSVLARKTSVQVAMVLQAVEAEKVQDQTFEKSLFPATAKFIAEQKKPHFTPAMCQNATKPSLVSRCKAVQSMQGAGRLNPIAKGQI